MKLAKVNVEQLTCLL